MSVDGRLATEGLVRQPEAKLQVFQYIEEPAAHRYLAAVETL